VVKKICPKKKKKTKNKKQNTDHNRNYSWAASKVLLFILQWEILICPSWKEKQKQTKTWDGPPK
jgi:hypothetical protein